MTVYSRPEMATERQICGRIRARVRENPCAYCKNRVTGWGRHACIAMRSYPNCTEYGAPAFELDPTTIRELEKAE